MSHADIVYELLEQAFKENNIDYQLSALELLERAKRLDVKEERKRKASENKRTYARS